jgi:hypothetical protein
LIVTQRFRNQGPGSPCGQGFCRNIVRTLVQKLAGLSIGRKHCLNFTLQLLISLTGAMQKRGPGFGPFLPRRIAQLDDLLVAFRSHSRVTFRQ